MSLPAWGRGLKQSYLHINQPLNHVAPRVGAWIETLQALFTKSSSFVAPRVGAWIETVTDNMCTYGNMSLPAWGRGLKLDGIL